MGFYEDRVLPRLIDWVLGSRRFDEYRARCVSGARGRVCEIGFGSGLNLPHYSAEVTELLAVEPSRAAMRIARRRIAGVPFPVRSVGLDGEALPLESDSVDSVVSTWTLCSIPDVAKAVAEIARVLKPSGTFHFLEHGIAPDSGVSRWQRRLDPLQKRLAGGCHLTRDIPAVLEAGGLRVAAIEESYGAGPRFIGYFYEGRAVSG